MCWKRSKLRTKNASSLANSSRWGVEPRLMPSAAEVLNQQLSQEQQSDLVELVKRREWASLLQLFRRLEQLVVTEFLAFQTAEEAFERRGKLEGFRLGLEILSTLAERGSHGGTSTTSSYRDTWVGNPSQVGSGISIPENPADER